MEPVSGPNDPRMVEVAVDARIEGTLTYLFPYGDFPFLQKGMRVVVPLGKRKVTGYAVGFPDASEVPQDKLRPVIEVLDSTPLFNETMLEIFKWASSYYLCPLAEVIKTALPSGINLKSKGVLAITDKGQSAILKPKGREEGHKNASSLKGDDLKLLEYLAETGEALPDDLSSSLGSIPESRVARLVKAGYIERLQKMGGPRVREKTEKEVSLAARPPGEEMKKLRRRAPERARLLDYLGQNGPTSFSALKESFKDPGRLIRPLTADGTVTVEDVPVRRDPFSRPLQMSPPPEKLMPGQEKAAGEFIKALGRREFTSFLLQGVTGSGKTEVYLRLIEAAFKKGLGSILLAPEIALTPQLICRFTQRFPADKIAVLHSGLGPGERHDEWWRIKRGEARVVIGARSAVFAPAADLGVIVVDEEQESAYKQDRGFMYNGRDLALMRAKREGAVAVLGSATPSLEARFRSGIEGGHKRAVLDKRVDSRPLPEVEIVDMRSGGKPAEEEDDGDRDSSGALDRVKERDKLIGSALISDRLRKALAENLEAGDQTILFLNRRGVSSFLLCLDCGSRLVCPNCEVSLVHHESRSAAKVDSFYGEPGRDGYLLCHYCGYHMDVPEVCPSCRGVRTAALGTGTELMEKTISVEFPGARILRMDSDSMSGKESWFDCLDRVSRGRVDIVIGTQMVAKGHDFPGVTLVGVILADLSLNMPDFRAAERTFQTLTQVAGRAGRGEKPGRVIIQTFQPDNYAIVHAVSQDYEGFYAREMEIRKAMLYPPFCRLANIRISGRSPEAAKRAAQLLGRAAKSAAGLKAFSGKTKVLGPAPAPIARIRGKSRWMALVKADSPACMGAFLRVVLERYAGKAPPGGTLVEVDRDPLSMM